MISTVKAVAERMTKLHSTRRLAPAGTNSLKSNCYNSQPEILEMAQSGSDANPINRPPIGNIVWGFVLNAVFPVILYKLSKRYYSPSLPRVCTY